MFKTVKNDTWKKYAYLHAWPKAIKGWGSELSFSPLHLIDVKNYMKLHLKLFYYPGNVIAELFINMFMHFFLPGSLFKDFLSDQENKTEFFMFIADELTKLGENTSFNIICTKDELVQQSQDREELTALAPCLPFRKKLIQGCSCTWWMLPVKAIR